MVIGGKWKDDAGQNKHPNTLESKQQNRGSPISLTKEIQYFPNFLSPQALSMRRRSLENYLVYRSFELEQIKSLDIMIRMRVELVNRTWDRTQQNQIA
jgi:hypothetical protein